MVYVTALGYVRGKKKVYKNNKIKVNTKHAFTAMRNNILLAFSSELCILFLLV